MTADYLDISGYDVCAAVVPTAAPTAAPTRAPTSLPSVSPTNSPTSAPTLVPTFPPSSAPTRAPTSKPTSSPTMAPTPSFNFGVLTNNTNRAFDIRHMVTTFLQTSIYQDRTFAFTQQYTHYFRIPLGIPDTTHLNGNSWKGDFFVSIPFFGSVRYGSYSGVWSEGSNVNGTTITTYFTNGDTFNCPGSIRRSAAVTFSCDYSLSSGNYRYLYSSPSSCQCKCSTLYILYLT